MMLAAMMTLIPISPQSRQGESHGHVRVFEGCYAHWCGTPNIMVKKSRARPVFLPAHHHQLYRSSVPADVPYLLGFNLKSTCSDVSSTGAVCSTRPPPGASHILGTCLKTDGHIVCQRYFVTTEHVGNIRNQRRPRPEQVSVREMPKRHNCRSTLAICTHSPERVLPHHQTRRAGRTVVPCCSIRTMEIT